MWYWKVKKLEKLENTILYIVQYTQYKSVAEPPPLKGFRSDSVTPLMLMLMYTKKILKIVLFYNLVISFSSLEKNKYFFFKLGNYKFYNNKLRLKFNSWQILLVYQYSIGGGALPEGLRFRA